MSTPAPNLFDGHASLALKEEDQKDDVGSKVAGSAPAGEAGEITGEQPAAQTASTAADATAPPAAADATAPPAVANDASAEVPEAAESAAPAADVPAADVPDAPAAIVTQQSLTRLGEWNLATPKGVQEVEIPMDINIPAAAANLMARASDTTIQHRAIDAALSALEASEQIKDLDEAEASADALEIEAEAAADCVLGVQHAAEKARAAADADHTKIGEAYDATVGAESSAWDKAHLASVIEEQVAANIAMAQQSARDAAAVAQGVAKKAAEVAEQAAADVAAADLAAKEAAEFADQAVLDVNIAKQEAASESAAAMQCARNMVKAEANAKIAAFAADAAAREAAIAGERALRKVGIAADLEAKQTVVDAQGASKAAAAQAQKAAAEVALAKSLAVEAATKAAKAAATLNLAEQHAAGAKLMVESTAAAKVQAEAKAIEVAAQVEVAQREQAVFQETAAVAASVATAAQAEVAELEVQQAILMSAAENIVAEAKVTAQAASDRALVNQAAAKNKNASMKKMKAALKSGGTKAFVPKAPKPPPLAEPVEPIVSETIVPMVAAETIAEKIKANVAEGTSQPVDTTARALPSVGAPAAIEVSNAETPVAEALAAAAAAPAAEVAKTADTAADAPQAAASAADADATGGPKALSFAAETLVAAPQAAEPVADVPAAAPVPALAPLLASALSPTTMAWQDIQYSDDDEEEEEEDIANLPAAEIALRAAMRAYEQTPNPKRIDEAEREADEAVYLAESIYGNIALAQTAADETAADADELTRAVGDNDPPAACTAVAAWNAGRHQELVAEQAAVNVQIALESAQAAAVIAQNVAQQAEDTKVKFAAEVVVAEEAAKQAAGRAELAVLDVNIAKEEAASLAAGAMQCARDVLHAEAKARTAAFAADAAAKEASIAADRALRKVGIAADLKAKQAIVDSDSASKAAAALAQKAAAEVAQAEAKAEAAALAAAGAKARYESLVAGVEQARTVAEEAATRKLETTARAESLSAEAAEADKEMSAFKATAAQAAAIVEAKTREITLIEERGAEKMEVARSAIAAADESASKASARAAARKAKSRAAHPAVVSVVKDVIMKVLDQNESKPPPGVRAVENFDSVMAPTIDTPDKGSPDVKASSFVSKIPSIDTATDVDVASPSRSAGSKIPAMVAGSDSRYCLDSCSCTLLESELRSRLRAAVASVPQAAGTILQPPPPPTTPPPPPQNQESKTGPRGRTRTQRQDQNQNQQQQEKQQQQPPLAPALLAACTCPSCDVPLSHRDLRQLLGPSITHRLYTCIAMYLLDTPSTQVGQQDVDLVAAAHSRAAAVAAAAAAAAAAGSSGGCKARASVHLSHQRACCPGTPASFISGLYDSLVGQEQQQKQESTGGAAGAGELQREEEESQVQGGGRGGKKGKKGKGGKGGEGKGRGGGGPGGGRGEGESATWAAGTGYGGGGSSKDEATAGMKKAALRQKQQDAILQQQLAGLTAALKLAGQGESGGAGGGQQRHMQPEPPQPAVVALVLCSALPYLLRMLLHNDSLQDIAARQGLYRTLMDLLRLLASSVELVEVFTISADEDPVAAAAARQQQQQQLAGTAGPGPGTSSSNSSSNSLMAVLKRLNTQCKVYKRSGQELGQDEDEEVTGALGMALELSSLSEDVSEAVSLWTLTLGRSCDEDGMLEADGGRDQAEAARLHGDNQQQQGGHVLGGGSSGPGSASGGQVRINGTKAGGAGGGGGGASGSSSRSALAQQQQQQKRQDAYVGVMQPLLLQEAQLLSGHAFRDQIKASPVAAAAGGDIMRRRLKRITEEISTLSTSLPLSWESSVFVAVDEDRMDVLRALIIPSSDTPYSHGFFVFDIYLPPEYPNRPPMVKLLTTGGGRVRFNPNLYKCGKVCLSLLGTWSGPSWEPATSTLLQVLVSISAMILVPDPYFNEPGCERSMATAAGKAASRQYNEQVRADTLQVALVTAVQLAAAEANAVQLAAAKANAAEEGVSEVAADVKEAEGKVPEADAKTVKAAKAAKSAATKAANKAAKAVATKLPGWDTFKEIIMHDLRAKKDVIKAQVQVWSEDATQPQMRAQMQQTAQEITDAFTML